MSGVDPLRDDIMAAASALARGLKGELLPWAGLAVVGDGSVEPEALLSEAADSDRPPIGTVRLLRFGVEALGDSGDSGRGIKCSGGG